MNSNNDTKSYRKQVERGFAFEDLIRDLLIKSNYKNVKESDEISNKYSGDIIFGKFDDLTVVEVKAYRPLSKPSIRVIEEALKRLQSLLESSNKFQNGILIISTNLDYEIYNEIYPNIKIWDLEKILSIAKNFPDIHNKIIDLFELDPSHKIVVKTKNDFIQGKQIIDKIKLIEEGWKDASKFEDWCIEALKYLFFEYLTGWQEQSSTVDGLHRRDLVCRVKDSETEVWQFISHTLRSRYIVFEFKNYSNKITQREIITTERYLYPMALRNCAFIISRKGVSPSAQNIIDGAMREHGKLIISLSEQDLIILLEGKDKGDDPNVNLFNKIDDFLIGLNR
ncbi:restriction endonuclease [Acinetobacter sp. yr461]|uniref:restriction endonuclease n=1 Tax=Acinetobacter sp. yr461 TaxID=1761742 RepID=UPI0008D19D2C|nr:restriction endonuclease [Acinetobacter sp. yr461]SEO25627.1 Restriction endonuclease [Acinetobacter sp. yr461]